MSFAEGLGYLSVRPEKQVAFALFPARGMLVAQRSSVSIPSISSVMTVVMFVTSLLTTHRLMIRIASFDPGLLSIPITLLNTLEGTYVLVGQPIRYMGLVSLIKMQLLLN